MTRNAVSTSCIYSLVCELSPDVEVQLSIIDRQFALRSLVNVIAVILHS